MTATGVLYIDEDCRDFFKVQLDEWYGADKWKLDGDEFEIWDMGQFPELVKVIVRNDENGEPIGKVEITSKFILVGSGGERYVECVPDKIKKERWRTRDL